MPLTPMGWRLDSEWERPRIAVVPTNGRPCLEGCLNLLMPQVDLVVLVHNGDNNDVWYWRKNFPNKVWIHSDPTPGVNISRWWNLGLDRAEEFLAPDTEAWDVAVINDDVLLHEKWFNAVSKKMRQLNCSAACSGGMGTLSTLHRKAMAVPLHTRMQGFAFMLAGEQRLRADEQFRWYCGDDDLDWQAREAGGMVMIAGYHVQHIYPNAQMTPQLQTYAAEDMGRLVQKWGFRPW